MTIIQTNSANFKSLLLRSIGSNDKTARSSAAERLKVAPGKTLQDLYRPNVNAQSPVRRPEDNRYIHAFFDFSKFNLKSSKSPKQEQGTLQHPAPADVDCRGEGHFGGKGADQERKR